MHIIKPDPKHPPDQEKLKISDYLCTSPAPVSPAGLPRALKILRVCLEMYIILRRKLLKWKKLIIGVGLLKITFEKNALTQAKMRSENRYLTLFSIPKYLPISYF